MSRITEGSWWATLPETHWSLLSSTFSQSGQELTVFKHLLEKNSLDMFCLHLVINECQKGLLPLMMMESSFEV